MKNIANPSTEELHAILESMNDEDIDFSDIPEILDGSDFVPGYRKSRNAHYAKLEPELFKWFIENYKDFDEAANAMLREYILSAEK
ncbi:MAG: hypothetical protein LBR22_11155 [Desulfovibrio sp.]|jgi:inorganic pyrophosphatase|nr:hypothetical protein [Desulfovibrio sp.]